MSAYQASQRNLMQQIYLQAAQGTNATSTPAVYWTTSTTSSTSTVTVPYWTNGMVETTPDDYYPTNHDITIRDGTARKIKLPDGTVIDVAADGSFTINDKDAKVTYRANRVHDFNSFINASDKLEAFIRFCGELGVRQSEVLNIPIKLFIGWLIIEAAMADGENKDQDVDLLEGIHYHVKPHCQGCGRFISPKLIARKIAFCRPVCLEAKLNEVAA